MTCLVRACSHSVLCCTGTAAGIALASLLWPSCSHIGYWTPILLNINLKRKLVFFPVFFFFLFPRDLLLKANRRLLSHSLWMGTQRMVLDHSDTEGYPGIFLPALGSQWEHCSAQSFLYPESFYHLPFLPQDGCNATKHYRYSHMQDFLLHLESGEWFLSVTPKTAII